MYTRCRHSVYIVRHCTGHHVRRRYHTSGGERCARRPRVGLFGLRPHPATPRKARGGTRPIALGDQLPECRGPTNQQRQPSHVGGEEGTPFRRDEPTTYQAIARPSRIDQVTVAVEAQQLESCVVRPGLPRLPVADGAQADAEQLGRVVAVETSEHPSIPKLLRRDADITCDFPVKNGAG